MKKKERKYIIVDEDNRPMSWHKPSQQICYNYPVGRTRRKLQTYTKERAEKAIMETIGNRLKWNMEPGEYYLMQTEV